MSSHSPLFSIQTSSHRRWNPLLEEWVLVSPHRSKRPWQGAVENSTTQARSAHVSNCYLCPGNSRAHGERNPSYNGVHIFDNDFSALSERSPSPTTINEASGIVRASKEHGICRVVCFSPRHDLTLPDLSIEEISQVVECWSSQSAELGARPEISHVMIFENKGEMMGCSNPHPHGQIWASSFIPNLALRSAQSQRGFFSSEGIPLLQRYLNWELESGERIVIQNSHWVAMVPFWAVWPFEVLVLPKRVAANISELDQVERRSWAEIIQSITRRYDNLFNCSFPYSMGIYQRPTDGQEWSGFVMHQTFMPPLLRSATIRKFMVGFELCAEPQRDITAEDAAEQLRSVSSAWASS